MFTGGMSRQDWTIAAVTDSIIRVDPEPFEMLPHWLLMNPELSNNAKIIYLILRKHRDYVTGQCYPGRARIAALCGVSSRTVDRELPNLVRVGAITIVKRKTKAGGDDSNLYLVHWQPFGNPQGGDTESPGGRQKVAKGGDRKSHELRPIDNKDVPKWIDDMEDGPAHAEAYLQFLKGESTSVDMPVGKNPLE